MEPSLAQCQTIHVLFVEDEVLISEWVTESLSDQGFEVKPVTNAADALRHFSAHPVDILFTDINLPGGMDGMALARQLRELQPNMPVVYASARANLLGSDGRVPGSIIVPKPYEPELVGRLLSAALKTARAAVPAA